MTEEAIVIDWVGMWVKYIKARRQDLKCFDHTYTKSITIDLADVQTYGKTGLSLADRVLDSPKKSVEDIRDAISESDLIAIYNEGDRNITKKIIDNTSIWITGVPKITKLREIRDEDIGKLISVEGLVKNVTEEVMQIRKASFRCTRCMGVTHKVQSTRAAKIQYPSLCEHCEKKSSWELLHDICVYEDVQFVSIQELHESLDSGEEPRSIVVELSGDLVGQINAGDQIIFTGEVFRWSKTDNNPVFKRRMQCYSFEKNQVDYAHLEITKEDLKEIEAFSKKKDVFKNMIDIISPSIYGMELPKLALILQMFGGVPVENEFERLRGDIHILLIGEPGIAKSQIARFVTRLSLRGIWTSGKGNSAAGLTATAVKDTIGNGDWMLQAGALVLADRGHVTIDEFDKMDKTDREILHEAMEQQEITIAKAGIVATMKTRCSVLAIANPKSGRFDDYMTLSQQIDLPPSLISRFDIIMVLKDVPDETTDGKIVDRIFDTRYDKLSTVSVDPEFLIKYISYARQTCFPKPTIEAKEKLKNYYLSLRGRYKNKETNSLPITARQFEALTRLAEASARARLSDVYDESDADRVISVVEMSLADVAKDPDTGEVDIDRIVNKISTGQRGRVNMIKTIIRDCSDERKVAKWDDVINRATTMKLNEYQIEEAKRILISNNEMFEPRTGFVRLIG